MFEWKDEYAVGHSTIDSQHKRLFQLASELHTAMSAGRGKEVLNQTLGTLVAYTKHHFSTEEQMMQKCNYPDYALHKSQHDQLTTKVVEFQKGFAAGKLSISVELLQFLKDWLSHHIGQTDRRIAAFLRNQAA